MLNLLFILISCFVVALISILGYIFLINKKTLHLFLDYSVAFAIGTILGTVFFHFFKHLSEVYSLNIGISIIIGIFSFFILEKIIHWHHCHKEHHKKIHIGYMTIFADALHNVFDGIFISSAYSINFATGIASTIAVLSHEIPQEIGDLGLLITAGFDKKKALLYNFLSALSIFFGVIIYFFIINLFINLKPYIIGFVAGNFLYLAMSDLIPLLNEKNTKKETIIQIIFLMLGICIMYALNLFI